MDCQELQQRRENLLKVMSNGSAALFFSARDLRALSGGNRFLQQSDFWYLTNFDEPEALLVLLKSPTGEGSSILFNRARDPQEEIWHGPRLGQEGAVARLGVGMAMPYAQLGEQLILILNQLPTLYHAFGNDLEADRWLMALLEKLRRGRAPKWRAPETILDWRPLVHKMRLVKSSAEIVLMRRGGEITASAHRRAMQRCHPGLFEYNLEAEVHHEFTSSGACFPAYETIVGAGKNGCILHYSANSAPLCSGDLILLDAGCCYRGYSSDMTRTFPVNGRFSPAQRDIYEVVLEAQIAALKMMEPGATLAAANDQAIQIMVTGLVRFGLLHGDIGQLIADKAYINFYMHGLGHWLGIEVHDLADSQVDRSLIPLAPGMTLTIEPGLYIAEDAEVPKQYRGIGIRIEDSVLITSEGHEVLTAGVPKEVAEIEALMQRGDTE